MLKKFFHHKGIYMALIKCHECGKEVSTQAKKCPNCGVIPKSKTNKIRAIAAVIILVVLAFYFYGGGIEHQVANDFTAQYKIAKANGDKMQTCVQAGIVSAAYLQAKDDENYKRWKNTEKHDCRAAGMPSDMM